VFHGVDDGLFQGQLDAEQVALAEVALGQELLDAILHGACLGGVAGNDHVFGDELRLALFGSHRDRMG